MDNLKEFFNPKSIAIIGASDKENKVGGILLRKAIKSKCKIYPVNPNHDSLLGLKCYKTISEVKKTTDLAVIAIPAPLVQSALEECGKKEIKNIILISAGFSEIGNTEGEKKIKDLAKRYKIRFLGPNCFGIFNSDKNIDLTFSKSTPQTIGKENITFISQSGALWSYIADLNIDFSNFVSLGNMSDLEFKDFISYFSKDKRTKSIILYIEKLKDGKTFIQEAKKAIKKGKIIYAVKAGSSEQGKEAAFSHTGSLATDYEIYKGAFKQAGIILCKTIEEALAKASNKEKKEIEGKEKIELTKNTIIITNAGGAAALASDYLAEKQIKVTEIKDLLGPATVEEYKTAIEKAIVEDKESSIIVILTPQSMTQIDETAQIIVKIKKQSSINLLPLFLGEKSMKEANKIFSTNNIPYFNTLSDFKDAIKVS